MPIQLGGLASGLDTGALIEQLVAASGEGLNGIEKRIKQVTTAQTTLSSLGTALATLKTASDALSDQTTNGAFAARASSEDVKVSALPTAQAGAYSVEVQAIAQAQRTYSASFASKDAALGQTGSLTIAVGGGAAKSVSVTATDTLDSIAGKINALDLRAAASVFHDGSTYRLQIRGLDTGAANALVFTETGTALDLNGAGATATAGKTVQAARNAAATVDGFAVTSASNAIAGAIPGVTITVSKVTTAPVSVTIDSDPDKLAGKVKEVVDAFNSVVKAVHSAAGFGAMKAQNPVLAGDSSLRTIASRLSSLVSSTFTGSTVTRLGDVGVTLAKDGTLSVDESKLKTAAAKDMLSVEKLFGRAKGATTGGAMAGLRDLVKEMTDTGGTFLVRSESLGKEQKRLEDRATAERTRLDRYAQALRKQFTAMEAAYSQNQSLLAQMQRLG